MTSPLASPAFFLPGTFCFLHLNPNLFVSLLKFFLKLLLVREARPGLRGLCRSVFGVFL